MKVSDLVPGDTMAVPLMGTAIFVARVTPHPLYPTLCLVIWWMVNERRWSLDALAAHMEIPAEVNIEHRESNLRTALLWSQQK